MTIERNDEAMDELVSKTYREHSVEQAPEHLNQKILRMATAAGNPERENGLWRQAWMKPLAWAATVGLSLAIVLEVTQVPDGGLDVPTSAVESLREEFEPSNTDLLEDARDRAARQSGTNREDLFNAAPRVEFEVDKSLETIDSIADKPATESAAAPVLDRTTRQKTAPPLVKIDKPTSPRGVKPKFADVQKFAPRPNLAPESAQSGIASFPAPDELDKFDIESSCDAPSRKTAKTWRACIEDLSQSGLVEDADREYRAFALEFPDEPSAFDPKK